MVSSMWQSHWMHALTRRCSPRAACRRHAVLAPRNPRAVRGRQALRRPSPSETRPIESETNMYSCDACGERATRGDRQCQGCGRVLQLQPWALDQSGNWGGANVGGNVDGDLIINPEASWDTRPRTTHDRSAVRAILPPDLLSLIAGVITIGGFLVAPHLPKSAQLTATLASGALAALTLYLATLAVTLRQHGFAVLPFGLGALERQHGRTFQTEPIATCPFCPEYRSSQMHLASGPEETMWVCNRNPKQHCLGFDPTQMPLLD